MYSYKLLIIPVRSSTFYIIHFELSSRHGCPISKSMVDLNLTFYFLNIGFKIYLIMINVLL